MNIIKINIEFFNSYFHKYLTFHIILKIFSMFKILISEIDRIETPAQMRTYSAIAEISPSKLNWRKGPWTKINV